MLICSESGRGKGEGLGGGVGHEHPVPFIQVPHRRRLNNSRLLVVGKGESGEGIEFLLTFNAFFTDLMDRLFHGFLHM